VKRRLVGEALEADEFQALEHPTSLPTILLCRPTRRQGDRETRRILQVSPCSVSPWLTVSCSSYFLVTLSPCHLTVLPRTCAGPRWARCEASDPVCQALQALALRELAVRHRDASRSSDIRLRLPCVKGPRRLHSCRRCRPGPS